MRVAPAREQASGQRQLKEAQEDARGQLSQSRGVSKCSCARIGFSAIDLTGVPYLTLWSDGGPFLCVEPCWGLTDHFEQRAFEDKEGIQSIAPGSDFLADFSIEPRL